MIVCDIYTTSIFFWFMYDVNISINDNISETSITHCYYTSIRR